MSRFVVHEHRASRVHFDLRLQIGGALKSWAIPKGPSMNPAEKRLAIRVADHPLEYLDFEGTIPQGMYGAGAVAIWDTGNVYYVGDEAPEAALEAGKLLFVLKGRKLKGGFALVRRVRSRDADEWLLVKRCDHAADRNWHIESAFAPVKAKRRSLRSLRAEQAEQAEMDALTGRELTARNTRLSSV